MDLGLVVTKNLVFLIRATGGCGQLAKTGIGMSGIQVHHTQLPNAIFTITMIIGGVISKTALWYSRLLSNTFRAIDGVAGERDGVGHDMSSSKDMINSKGGRRPPSPKFWALLDLRGDPATRFTSSSSLRGNIRFQITRLRDTV